MRVLKPKKIKLLKEYFEKESEVLLAFLFGSFAKGRGMAESDLDIGVYLKDKKKEDKIWIEVSRITEKEVDLVCLNDAPATLISNVFQTGIPLKIGDKKLYWELYLQKSTEAEDFLSFAEDFWRIYKRSKSLSKEEKTRLIIRLEYLETELEELNRFRSLSYEEYFKDKDKRKLIERWCENILNALIDISKIILASEKKKLPKHYEESLRDFALLVGFNKEKAEQFSKFARLRNILAHEYLDIRFALLSKFIATAPPAYNYLIDFCKNKLSTRV